MHICIYTVLFLISAWNCARGIFVIQNSVFHMCIMGECIAWGRAMVKKCDDISEKGVRKKKNMYAKKMKDLNRL